MTLCIAAACQDRGRPRIVVATDWRAEGAIAGGDIQDKLYWIGNNLCVLIAGTVTRAIELKDTIYQYIEAREERKVPLPKSSDLADEFRRPVIRFKRKLVGEYIGLRFGLSYTQFLNAVATSQLPESVAIDAFKEIDELNQECSLILCLFVEDGRPRILKIEQDGSLERVDSFATIGSGGDLADSVLFQREHGDSETLGAALYHVYEAMTIGSIAPGVGKEFTINVLCPPDRDHKTMWGYVVNDKGMNWFKSQFKKRGPKPFKNFVKLPPDILGPDFTE